MKVSVIISNYNYGQYLSTAISSVLAQTYQNFEIIIIDDGSTDNSREVIKYLHEKSSDKIKFIFQSNQGQGAAFNTAFEAVNGEVIAFLDADDIWLPNKLEQIVDAFGITPDIVSIMHLLNLIDANGHAIGDTKSGWIPNEDLADIILKTGNAWNYPPTSGLAYRRSALEKVFPIDPIKWRLCADGCLVYCTAFLGKVVGLDEVLASYRIHGSNNHVDNNTTVEKQLRSQAGVEMTNQYLNKFLERIQYPARVNLLNNLSYRRSRYYLQKQWDLSEALAISKLISEWHFYTWQERINYLVRFWMKSLGFLIGS